MAIFDKGRENLCLHCLICIRVAEKIGDGYEDVLVQQVHLSGLPLQILDVVIDAFDLVQHHPPDDAPLDCCVLVMREVDAASGAQQDENLVESVLAFGQQHVAFFDILGRHVGMAADPGQLTGNPLRREHKVHDAGSYRAARHAIVLRSGRVLGKSNSALGFDRCQPQSAI